MAAHGAGAATVNIEAEHDESGSTYEDGYCYYGSMEVSDDNFAGHGEAAGWARFDTSEIPDGSEITSVTLNFYPYLWDEAFGPHVDFNGFASDPVGQSCSQRFQDATNGPTYHANGWVIGTGWRSVDLGTAGAAALENGLADDWFAVGLDHRGNDAYWLVAEGFDTSNDPYVVVTYEPQAADQADLELQTISVSPAAPLSDGSDVEVRVQFENIGDATAAGRFFLRVQMNGVEVEDQAFYDYAPGENRNELVWKAPLATGQYIVNAVIDADDEVPESLENNNTANFIFDVLTPPADILIEPTQLSFGPGPGTPIFVELDFMESAGHSHRPTAGVIDRIVQTFAAEGYSIHIEVDDALTHQDAVDIVDWHAESSPDIQAILAEHFDHQDDARYFYSLWGHAYTLDGQSTGGSTGFGDIGGRVHLVTLGGGTPPFSYQVGTFIHELGHNFGQLHGGTDHDNFKPNYLSVMNYYYQLDGIGPALVAEGFASSAPDLDDFGYSHGTAPALDENDLDETAGLSLGVGVDWDCDGDLEPSVARDIGGVPNPGTNFDRCQLFGNKEVLTDYDNWGDIADLFGAGLAPRREATASQPCISVDAHHDLHQRIEALRQAGVLQAAETLPVGVGLRGVLEPLEGTFTIFNQGGETLEITAMVLDQPEPWITWSPAAPFSVPAEGSVAVTVSVALEQAPEGMSQRRLIVSSDDADENPYPDAVFLNIERATCHRLETEHFGSGTSPVATPDRSLGCFTAGEYVAGAVLSLQATPASGWAVEGWSGTSDDSSTSATNSVVMPAADHEVAVTYAPICHQLSTGHTGQGVDPVPTPASSDGCAPGTYVEDEAISLAATAAAGWTVSGWSGTTDDSSTSATGSVVMPATDHEVLVAYAPICHQLSTGHSGQGADPVPTPASSAGCAPGTYVAAEAISLAATASDGWTVSSWSGTSEDSSTSATGTLVMPATDHEVSVHYGLLETQLLVNGGCEHSGAEGDPLQPWTCHGGCDLERVTDPVAQGDSACLVSNLTASWQGPAQLIDPGLLTNGATYNATARVLASAQGMTAQIMLFIQHTGGSRFIPFSGFAPVSSGEYSSIGGSATVDWQGTLLLARFYVQGAQTEPFYVDDLRLSSADELAFHDLLVTRDGPGEGSVQSVPSGIDCGTECHAVFPAGTVVELEATPDAGSVFAGWSGACTGSGTCQVTMDSSHGVVAAFAVDEPQLNLLVNPECEPVPDPWVCHIGCSIDSGEPAKAGSGSCRVSDLTQSWQGPSQTLNPGFLTAGSTYCARAWIRGTTPFEGELVLYLASDQGTSFTSLGGRVNVSASSFTLLEGSSELTWTGQLQEARLYAQGTTEPFFLDEAFFGPCQSATADQYLVPGGGPLDVPAPGVLGNDGDPVPLVATVVRTAANGSLTLRGDGSFLYQPAPGFEGTDTFTYQASDGATSSPATRVTIWVGFLFADGFESGDLSRWSETSP